MNFIYESEIVTFQKILTIWANTIPMFHSSEGGRKDKTDLLIKIRV